jgi:hypothetical protein
MKFLRGTVALLAGACVTAPLHTAPGPAASIAGWYEGAVQSRQFGEVQVTANLHADSDSIVGFLNTPLGDFPIAQDSLTRERVVLRFTVGDGDVGTITGAWSPDEIRGSWRLGDDGGDLLLRRTGPPRAIVEEAGPRFDLSIDEWRADLHFLATELPRRHGSAFHTVSRDQFEDSVRALEARLPALQPHEVFVGMGRLVALVGDGHTYLELPAAFRHYPVRLYAFGDTLRIVQAAAGHESLLGARVLAIGGREIGEAARLVRRQIAEENDWYVLSNLPWFLTIAELLHGHGVTSVPDSALWAVETVGGDRLAVWLRPAAAGETVRLVSAARTTPLDRQLPGEDLWHTFLADTRTMYVSFRGYPPRTAFREFFAAVLQESEDSGADRLVIDMRHNGGGDFTKVRELLLPQLKGHRLNERGRLFVVIGRRTFSAAMTNAADFLKETNATLAGEPTGARPNGWQEKGEFRLPNSRLAVSVSTQYYRFLEGDPPAVMPHQHVALTWEDYRAGRDPVLEWIVGPGSSRPSLP